MLNFLLCRKSGDDDEEKHTDLLCKQDSDDEDEVKDDKNHKGNKLL